MLRLLFDTLIYFVDNITKPIKINQFQSSLNIMLKEITNRTKRYLKQHFLLFGFFNPTIQSITIL